MRSQGAGSRQLRTGRKAPNDCHSRMVVPRCDQSVNLSDLVCSVAGQLRRLAGESICLEFVPAWDLGLIAADPDEMEQMMVHLVTSAKEAMPEGGRLTTALANVLFLGAIDQHDGGASAGAYILVAVSDTGRGSSGEVRLDSHNAGPVEREVAERGNRDLSAVRDIVRRNHGFVEIETGAGRGTTIAVYLPWAEQPGADMPASEMPVETICGEGRLV